MAHVRMRNDTGEDLEAVRLHLLRAGTEPVDFGPLRHGAASDYHELPGIRRVAQVEASGPGGPLVLQPYDVVGEPELPPGHYTYRLGSVHGRLTLDVDEDGTPDAPHGR